VTLPPSPPTCARTRGCKALVARQLSSRPRRAGTAIQGAAPRPEPRGREGLRLGHRARPARRRGAAKAALDGASGRALRGCGFGWKLAFVPVKDPLFAYAWVRGFTQSTVDWPGNRLRVLEGSRLGRPEGAAEDELGADARALVWGRARSSRPYNPSRFQELGRPPT
jgi:hypothetical protein